MKFVNKNILIISPESWGHIFVSKHHYATHLAKRGNQVYFLNPPGNELKCEKTEFENVYSLQYKGFIKGLRFLSGFIQRALIRKEFDKLEKLCNTKFDVVWSFDNSVFFDFSALSNKVFCISHIVDLNQDFEFEKTTKSADLCLAVCSPILQKQKKYNKKSHFINHGFNQIEDIANNFELPGQNRIKVFYAGNLDIKYIDWSLINKLVNKFKTIDYIFAGPWNNEENKKDILKNNNLFHIGVVKPNELHSLYDQSDILIITYKYYEFSDQLSNSHKMMEYLASGKMIVATWTEEYAKLSKQGLFKMAKSEDEFLSMFQEVSNNILYWNNKDLVIERRTFANQNTYENQINRIEKIIKSNS